MMERKTWIDNAKIFGIFLVVLGHYTPNYKEALSAQILYQFHLPLFFLISGYLTKEYSGKFLCELKKISKRLLIPYILLVFIGWAFEYIFIGQTCNWGGVISSFTDDWYKTFFGIPSGRVNSMWFVFALYGIKIMDLAYEKILLKHTWIKTTLLVLYVVFITCNEFGITIFIPRPVIWMVVAFPFFKLGKQTKLIVTFFENINTFCKASLIFLLCLSPLLGVMLNGFVDLYSLIYGKHLITYYIIGYLSSIGILMLFENVVSFKSSFIRILSDGTIVIIAFHKLLLYPILNFNTSLICRIALSVLVVAAFYYPIILLKNKCPILLGKSKKK